MVCSQSVQRLVVFGRPGGSSDSRWGFIGVMWVQITVDGVMLDTWRTLVTLFEVCEWPGGPSY